MSSYDTYHPILIVWYLSINPTLLNLTSQPILIKVQARGDPLFLKQTYGTGLAVSLTVDRMNAAAIVDVVKQVIQAYV